MFNNYFKDAGFMFKYLFVKMQSYKIKNQTKRLLSV